MREITTHKCSDLNEAISVTAFDEPGPGGANHDYEILAIGFRVTSPPKRRRCEIHFQKGAVKDVGLNGISDEALLAIVEDRLKCFQAGEFACDENDLALTCVSWAMDFLKDRTRDRIERGVEGKSQK